ncbi:MAG TPA: proprotein convertase P-domain-containing protein [Patescibacteria group bacterium]|nr:proprotein convertase P-domain-containing protein [Patescibacteria group bacterium]
MNASPNRILALICALAFAVLARAAPTDLDTSFGGSGDLLDPFVTAGVVTRLDGRALAVSSDQLTYIVGGANGGAVLESGFIGVLNPNGSIATHLNGSGYALLPNARFEDLVLLPDGKVLACGLSYTSQIEHRWLVARFNADLTLDTSWAGQGYVVGSFGPLSICESIEQMSDARIVIGGRRGSSNSVGSENGFIAALTQAGGLDPAFASNGLTETNVATNTGWVSPRVSSIVEGAAGSIVMSGGLGLSGLNQLMDTQSRDYVLSYGVTGALVAIRDPGGLYQGDMHHYAPWTRSWGEVHASPVGQIRRGYQNRYRSESPHLATTFVAGYEADLSDPPLPDFAVWGALAWPDSQYELDGYLFGSSALMPNDRLIVAGSWRRNGENPARARMFLQRIDSNGLDDSFFPAVGFNQDAYLYRPAGQADTGADPFPIVRDLAVGRNGRITVLSRRSSGQNGVNVIRFMGDGIDSSTVDLEPAPMALGAVTTATGDLAQSNLVAIDGLPANVRVPLFVLGGEYKLNSGPWQRHPTYAKYGDFVRVRGYASAMPGQQHTVSLFVGGLRGKNSWDAIGNRQRADFVITSATAALAGQRCSDNVFASGCSQAIPDNGSAITSELPLDYALAGDCNYISRVRVGLDIDHPYLGDLKVTLLDPNYDLFGSEGNVVLLDRVRNGEAASSGSCTADGLLGNAGDDASDSADSACAATGGSGKIFGWVRPSQPLSALVSRRGTNAGGTSSVGTWTLVVRDLASSDVGQLNNWSIAVECTSMLPSPDIFANGFE